MPRPLSSRVKRRLFSKAKGPPSLRLDPESSSDSEADGGDDSSLSELRQLRAELGDLVASFGRCVVRVERLLLQAEEKERAAVGNSSNNKKKGMMETARSQSSAEAQVKQAQLFCRKVALNTWIIL